MGLTMQIKHSLEQGEYDDPSKVRALLKSGKFDLLEFKDALWEAVLTAFPCPKERGIPETLTAAKKNIWKQYAEENPEASQHDFVAEKCKTSNLCKQCESKKKLITFFEEISGDSADTIRHRLTSWLSGKVKKLDRLTYIQLCFAFNMKIYPTTRMLTEEEKAEDANRFLTLACKQPPLYTVKPEEAVYYFCLANPQGRNNSENWKYACELVKKLESMDCSEKSEDDVYTMHTSMMIEGIHTEKELLDFVSKSRLDEHELYATAKANCEFLFSQFEDSAAEKESSEILARGMQGDVDEDGKRSKIRSVRKSIACELLDKLEEFDDTGVISEETIELLREYTLGEILHASDRLDEIINGEALPDRNILLLTVLAQNCGMSYDADSNTLDESEELTDMPSFDDYFRGLSALLRTMGMAPLYPRWRMDFVVLYAYHLIKKDVIRGREPDALSEYMISALKLITEE